MMEVGAAFFHLEAVGKLWRWQLGLDPGPGGMERRSVPLSEQQNQAARRQAGKIAIRVNRKFIQIIPTPNCLKKRTWKVF